MKKTVSKASRMIRDARVKKGWTQLQIGKMMGHNYGNFIGMIESGASQVPFDMIPQLCSLLDLDPKKLLREVMLCRHPELAKYL
ncbi:MAG: helix-turn-helix transcriptional regulator [Desulfobacterales bacterium]|jgi:transcriptional regulator with XRE-family HTH domain|nr:helix-turn-helix transcriptional regulator [Desulfobacterales bacterium]